MIKEIQTILAVGSIAIDTIETSHGTRNNILGGSATYFSLAASKFAQVKLVGVVGADFPSSAWEMFNTHQINTDNVQIKTGKTFHWGCRYSNDFSKRETLFTDLGVFKDFLPKIDSEDCKSSLVFLGNIQPELQLDVARRAVSAKYIVSDTMNLWIDLYPDMLGDVFAISQILLINDEEAYQYTGLKDLSAAANCLHRDGPSIVIIKRGGKGAYLSNAGQGSFIPAFPINKLVDPTGAGDTFAGGLLGYLAQTESPDFIEAVLWGTVMASFCVESFGINSLLRVSLENFNNRIAILKDNMLTKKDI